MEETIRILKGLNVGCGKDTPTPTAIINEGFVFTTALCLNHIDKREKLARFLDTAFILEGQFFETDEHLYEALLEIDDIELVVELLEREENAKWGLDASNEHPQD